MKKNNEYVEPLYLYNAKNKPTDVYLSIEDYQCLLHKFEKLSKEVRRLSLRKKSQASKAVARTAK